MNIVTDLISNFAVACRLDQSVFGIPTWYKYLDGERAARECKLLGDFDLAKVESLMGIGVAIVEILLFFAGIIAVGYIIYGGFRYVLSQGEPENTKVAKDAVLNAVIGLLITIIATSIVRFLGNRLVT